MKQVGVFVVGVAALSIGACEVQQVEVTGEEASDVGERVLSGRQDPIQLFEVRS